MILTVTLVVLCITASVLATQARSEVDTAQGKLEATQNQLDIMQAKLTDMLKEMKDLDHDVQEANTLLPLLKEANSLGNSTIATIKQILSSPAFGLTQVVSASRKDALGITAHANIPITIDQGEEVMSKTILPHFDSSNLHIDATIMAYLYFTGDDTTNPAAGFCGLFESSLSHNSTLATAFLYGNHEKYLLPSSTLRLNAQVPVQNRSSITLSVRCGQNTPKYGRMQINYYGNTNTYLLNEPTTNLFIYEFTPSA